MTRRIPGEIFVGMRIEHMFRGQMNSPEFDWYCTVDEINKESNELKVTVTGRNGYSHPETWDMDITLYGLNDGEYLEVEEVE